MSTGKQRSLLQLLLVQRVLCPAARALKSQTRPLPPSVATTSFSRHRHCQRLPRLSPTPTAPLFRRDFSSSPLPTANMSDIVHETIKGKIQTQSFLSSCAISLDRLAAQSRDALPAPFLWRCLHFDERRFFGLTIIFPLP